MIEVKRVYELKGKKMEGYAILVDGLWPRGIRKTDLKIDEWLKVIAPSASLRKWFNHDPEKWKMFKTKYKEELKQHKEELQRIRRLEKEAGKLVLLYGARDEAHNNAVVLKEVLES